MNRRDLYFFNSFLAQTMVVGLLSAVAVVKCGMSPVVVSEGRNLRNTCQRLNYVFLNFVRLKIISFSDSIFYSIVRLDF